MRDKQVPTPSGQPSIPVVSALLHCVSMTALVYLRSSFGFVYLRPKSIFVAFSWAFALFTVYAWNEPQAWRQYRLVCLFGLGSAALYWIHLLAAFVRELNRKGEHDQYSGKSHLVRMMGWVGKEPTSLFEMDLHLWAEPGAILFFAAVVRWIFGEPHLSSWLFFAAFCLWLKEALNYWHHLRQRKRQEDIFSETEDSVEPPTPNIPNAEPPKATRSPRVKRPRNAS